MYRSSPVSPSLGRHEPPPDNRPSDPLPHRAPRGSTDVEALLTAEDVARRLSVSTDWVWDHSSRRKPLLPVIRMGDGTLRYRASGIELFIDEQERRTALRRRSG